MPFNIGPGELILILIIALVVLGPGKLPDVASSLGRSIREFRKAATDVSEAGKLDATATTPVAVPTAPAAAPPTAPAAAAPPPPPPVAEAEPAVAPSTADDVPATAGTSAAPAGTATNPARDPNLS
jgi:TatA/E family protein of Tat protein translocase